MKKTRRSAPSHEGDLLGASLAVWRAEPMTAFEGWIAEEPIRPGSLLRFRASSVEVYAAMWSRFLSWCAQRGVSPLSLDQRELAFFLDGARVKAQHRRRYLLLLRRVYAHLRRLDASIGNPAGAYLPAPARIKSNAPATFLSPIERAALVALLSPDEPAPDADAALWLRDQALCALLLGGGLKVGELTGCSVNCVDLREGVARLEPPLSIRAHQARLMPFALAPLRAWERERARRPGRLLFPSDEARGEQPLDPASVFRAVKRKLARASCNEGRAERARPQTLRNTSAADLIESGHGPELLRRKVPERTTHRVRGAILRLPRCREAKIDEVRSEIVPSKDDVLEFDVAVHQGVLRHKGERRRGVPDCNEC